MTNALRDPATLEATAEALAAPGDGRGGHEGALGEGGASSEADDGGDGDVSDDRVHAILEHVAAPDPAALSAGRGAPVLRAARLAAVTAGKPSVVWRGLAEPVAAVVDEGVEPALLARAFLQGDAVLVEVDPGAHGGHGASPVIVGVLQTRLPRAVEVTGETVIIEAQHELLLRAGSAAIRLKSDGDVEVVGSRILTMSRGLFRIVGRMLRLN